MTKKLIDATAKIIRKCYSAAALEEVAHELGATIRPGEDVFKALVDDGKANDFAQAVEIVAAYLQDDHDHGPERGVEPRSQSICSD